MSRLILPDGVDAPVDDGSAKALPPPGDTFRVYLRCEPGTLNVVEVVMDGPNLSPFVTFGAGYLPDQNPPQAFVDHVVGHFETTVRSLRGLGLRVKRLEKESGDVMQGVIMKTIERFKTGIVGPDGRMRIASIEGRPGIFPAVAPSAVAPPPAVAESTSPPPAAPEPPATRTINLDL